MSNRTKINNSIIKSLRSIDGRTSPYDASYTFFSNLHTNVYSGLKYIDEINDFPSIFVTTSKEKRQYNTRGNTEAIVYTVVRCYVYGDNSQLQLSAIFQDIEHIIYNMKLNVEFKSLDVTIDSINTDSGLLEPYGMAEIFLSSRFEI